MQLGSSQVFLPGWHIDTYISISWGAISGILALTSGELPDEDVRIDFAMYCRVGSDNVLEIGIDKVVERVSMLLDQAFDLEEGGQEIPFVLSQ